MLCVAPPCASRLSAVSFVALSWVFGFLSAVRARWYGAAPAAPTFTAHAQVPAIVAVYAFAEDGSEFQSHRPGAEPRAVTSAGSASDADSEVAPSVESVWERLLDRAQHYLAPPPTPAQVARRYIGLYMYVASLAAYSIVVGFEWGGTDADKADGFYNAVELLVFDVAILSTAAWYVRANSRCGLLPTRPWHAW